jgi:hypothetical protein
LAAHLSERFVSVLTGAGGSIGGAASLTSIFDRAIIIL